MRWLAAIFAVVLGLLALGWFKSGGLDTPVLTLDGSTPSAARDLPGISCEPQVIKVKLSPDGWRPYRLVGELCYPGTPDNKVLQVLVSGSGYGPVYWDFPYQPDTYSYQRAALRAGYATFNFYRLGIGESDHPLGATLTVDNQAHVLSEVISALTAARDYAAVVTVGHSFGSVIAIANALNQPEQVDGIVLTGYAHNTNPDFTMAMRTGVDAAAFKGPFAGRIIDPSYLLSKPETRGDTFYTRANAEPEVIATDELNRQPTAVGEAITASKYFGPQSRELQVPVFMLLGEDDFVVCGGALDCRDHAATIRHEQSFFGPSACLEMVVLDDTGHDANLHRNAPQSFAYMLDWISRRVGKAEGSGPVAPCQPAAGNVAHPDLVLWQQTEASPWGRVDLLGNLPVRLLNDAADGRQVAVADLPAGWQHELPGSRGRTLEAVVLSGELRWQDTVLGEFDYGYLPAQASPPRWRVGDEPARVLLFLDPPRPTDGDQARLIDADALPWRPGVVAKQDTGTALALEVKDLLWVESTGQRTWLLRLGDNFDIGWEVHEDVEEGFLLAGDYRIGECLADGPVVGDYPPGGYFYRPGGIGHSGPDSGTRSGAFWLLRTPTTLTVKFVDSCADASLSATR